MAWTLVAFDENVANSSIDNVAGAADPHVTVSGDDITVPELDQLVGYFCLSTDASRFSITSPSLRADIPIEVEEFETAAEPSTYPPFHDRFETPAQLEHLEALNVQAVSTAGARQVGLIFLGKNHALAVPKGQMVTIQATNATTLVAHAWTNGALTFRTTLPAGRYAVVGMRAQAAGLISARLVTPSSPWRPGCIGFDTDLEVSPPRLRYGRAGSWVEFEHNTPPTVDFLSLSADTSQSVVLDLVKIRKGAPKA